MEKIKRCQTCKQELPVTNFCKNNRSKDGYNYHCKPCVKVYQTSIKDRLQAYQKEYQKKYRVENKESLYEYIKNWTIANPEKAKASHIKASAKYRAKQKQLQNEQ